MKNLKSQLEKLEHLAGKGSEEINFIFYLLPSNFPKDMKIEDCLSYQKQAQEIEGDKSPKNIIMVSCSDCKEACKYVGLAL